jgi:hypothetical protein
MAMNSFVVVIALFALGIFAGYVSGIVGIGGGVVIVPALVLIFGFSQHTAQGTTLALLIPPIGIFAAMSYYQKGFVDVKSAIIICIGFIIGGLLGGKMAVDIPENVLRKIFAALLIILGIRMFFYTK